MNQKSVKPRNGNGNAQPMPGTSCRGMGTMTAHSDKFLSEEVRNLKAKLREKEKNEREMKERYQRVSRSVSLQYGMKRWSQDSALQVKKKEMEIMGLIENTPVSMCFLAPSGDLIRANRHQLSVMQYTEAELTGKPLASFFVEKGLIHDAVKKLRAGEIVHNLEATMLCKDGSRRNVIMSASGSWEGGVLIQTYWTIRDITEIKKTELNLRRAHDRFAQEMALHTQELSEVNKVLREEIEQHRRVEEQLKMKNEEFEKIQAASFNVMEDLEREIAERRRAEADILRISNREQVRIGQDLHDGLCQQMTGIAFMAKVLEQRLQRRGVEEYTDAGRIVLLLNQAVTESRNMARGLYPIELETGGMSGAMTELAYNTEKIYGVRCTVENGGNLEGQDGEFAVHLYRIAQEAIHNAVRHGKAKNIVIRAEKSGGEGVLFISDDGIGIKDP